MWFIVTMCTAGLISVAIFPAMLQHIFSGYRGQQSFDNLLHSSWFGLFRFYYGKLDSLFGGMLIGILIIAGIFCVIYRKKIESDIVTVRKWTILFFPCILYFLTITKIAVMMSERYISPIYSISIILFTFGMKRIVDIINIWTNKYIPIISILCVTGFMLGNSWRAYEWKELYLEAESYMNIAKEYGQNNECINIYDKLWESTSAVSEFEKYQAISFISVSDLELLDQEIYKEYDHVVVYFDWEIGEEKINDILKMIIAQNPALKRYEQLYQYNYHVAYYLE